MLSSHVKITTITNNLITFGLFVGDTLINNDTSYIIPSHGQMSNFQTSAEAHYAANFPQYPQASVLLKKIDVAHSSVNELNLANYNEADVEAQHNIMLEIGELLEPVVFIQTEDVNA
jgi:hypothetical protein